MENICGAGHSDRIDFFTATPHSGIRTDDHVKPHFNGGFHLSGVDDTAYAEDHGVVRVFPETGFSHFQQIGHCFLKDFFWNTEGNLSNISGFHYRSNRVDHIFRAFGVASSHNHHDSLVS